MLNDMALQISAAEHLGRLLRSTYLYEKVDYLLNLYETEGWKMLEVLSYYSDFESDGLVIFAALARRIVIYEGKAEAIKTLAKFEVGLAKILEGPPRPTITRATAAEISDRVTGRASAVIVEEA